MYVGMYMHVYVQDVCVYAYLCMLCVGSVIL